MAERACAAVAESSDTLMSVSVRIGWCQSSENSPDTTNTSGLPGEVGVTGLVPLDVAFERSAPSGLTPPVGMRARSS